MYYRQACFHLHILWPLVRPVSVPLDAVSPAPLVQYQRTYVGAEGARICPHGHLFVDYIPCRVYDAA